MSDYYTINWDKISPLADPEQLQVLADINTEVTAAVGAARAAIVAAEIHRQLEIRKPGAQRRAAAALDMKPGRINQIWKDWNKNKQEEGTP